MQTSAAKRRVVRHILALVSSTVFLVVVPVALYGLLIVWSGDLGGPLNLIIIPMASAIIGFAISLVVFLPLSLLSERFDFRRWLRVVGFSTGALVAVVAPGWIYIGITKVESRWLGLVSAGGSLCLYLVGGFFVYLCCLAICRRVFP
jgi:hypothetical protein